MTKKTKMWLAVGGLAAVAGGGVAYYYYNKNKATTPAQLPPGMPVTTLTSGVRYQFAALTPSGISDTSALEVALNAADWSDVHIDFFMGTGNKGRFPIADTGYVATATWRGSTGAPVPQGVVATVAA